MIATASYMYRSSLEPVFKTTWRSCPHRQVLDLSYLDGVVERFVAGTEIRGAQLSDLMSLALTAAVGWFGTDRSQ